jgi:hypothetical protein
LKNGVRMPYNPKQLYTTVDFKEKSMHILLEAGEDAEEFLEDNFWD